ncbi:TPA: LOW QUALITY PROTEIN: hypothetical protein N0F65_008820 [Lagenidium giganteum]|uniref:Aspartate racemase n=1 Tax=Lagenidium giganteum TaxID=4803 RepID=A0AAV2YZ21_9STRA|nr:TPA: LOW QUALITY PROTEIN: hypothetical protein N0F65_008820 [Lagenidium giganteum]
MSHALREVRAQARMENAGVRGTMIGICGGVGPAAGILLHQTILEHTASQGVDQGHLNVCHFSCPADIADRAAFLEQQTASAIPDTTGAAKNPAVGMAKTVKMMSAAAMAVDRKVITAVPCVTFHAPSIWNEFQRLIVHDFSRNITCLNMIQEAVNELRRRAPEAKIIGLLSTSGTRSTRVFHDMLEPLGYLRSLSEQKQLELHETILNPVWGVKSSAPLVNTKCVNNFHRYARLLIAQGAHVIIMGCTEIPFVFNRATAFEGIPLVDPIVALARALIQHVEASRLRL